MKYLIAFATIAVVIFILLFPLVTWRSSGHHMRRTKSLMMGLSAALDRYYLRFGEYPPSTIADPFLTCNPPVPVDGGSLYKYLCGVDGRGPTEVRGREIRRLEPFYTVSPKFIKKVGQEIHIVDEWGQEIVYLNCAFYTAAKKAADPHYDSKTDPATHNSYTYDMYSTGPDMKKDPGHDHIDNNHNGVIDEAAELIDDITNYPEP